MIRFRKAAAVFLAGAVLFCQAAGASGFATYLEDGTTPSLQEYYAGRMTIGVRASEVLDGDGTTRDIVSGQCGLLACEEQTGAAAMIDRGSSRKGKDPGRGKIKLMKAGNALDFARDNGLTVRAGTVADSGNIPEWFFAEKWADRAGAPRVDRETAAARMQNAIRDQIELLNGTYPGLVSEWTVVRNSKGKDLFREIIGDDYIRLAFETARACAAEGQKLFYASGELPDAEVAQMIFEMHAAGIADGFILECGAWPADGDLRETEETLRTLAEAGIEIRLEDLEIRDTDRTAAGQVRLASGYKAVFEMAERLGTVHGISFPSLRDREDRKEKETPPRLFNMQGHCTAAFFGAMQDEDIPLPGSVEAVQDTVDRLNLEMFVKKEEAPVIVYKKASDHNPVMVQRFGADPWAMVYNGRVYIYATGDEPMKGEGDRPKTNDYSNIVTLRVLSSADMVNWEDHGSVRAAGGSGAAKWAGNSWAPCAAWKTIDGQDKFFLYFANSGGGIGVLTADSPTGPFTDPLGKPLVSRLTPTCAEVIWLFDPAVLVDEDGSAYLYFGGGIPEGKQANPGTARVVKLCDDMISLDGDPVVISPPWLFEDSGINRFGDTYVYSYCSNFNVPATGSSLGFYSGEIVYMTSDRPMGPFTFGGRVLENPGKLFGAGGNNHHCMFSFEGQWYITYHAATLDKKMKWNAGYRSVFVDRLELDEDELPALSRGTYRGVEQLHAFNPYAPVPAATAVTMAGMTTAPAGAAERTAGSGRMEAVSTTSGGWIAVAGVDFRAEGASSVRLSVRSEVPARIEILTDDPDGEVLASVEIPALADNTEITVKLPEKPAGIHDVYFRFTESGVAMQEWQFNP